ncbi:MAG: P-II family nitrogen regulator [Deltaproteobacteria bacterium]
MTLAMIVCGETELEAVIEAIEKAGGAAYTVLNRLHGKGRSGRHSGTEAALGENSAILIQMDALLAARVHATLRSLVARLKRARRRSEIHAFAWESETWL